MNPPTGPVPPRWKRVTLPGLPRGVSVLSIPGVGTGWYRRDSQYWLVRVGRLVLVAAVLAVQLLVYRLVLVGDPHARPLGAQWWGVLLFGLLAGAEGYRAAGSASGGPFTGVRPRNKVTDALLTVAFVVYFVATVLIAPGFFLAATVDGLRPVPHNERIARSDLDAQLDGRKAGKAGKARRRS
ncbi:hypothetical protein ACFYNO_07780 [Kitasatospora sp. NPDC006697]|uniref:hypothetical protein n=1 Tax=Kitasatospora sp. NPDC006697 TaxID=3364020 RepID=UPI00368491FE